MWPGRVAIPFALPGLSFPIPEGEDRIDLVKLAEGASPLVKS
jgi:hypothetical protein